MERKNNRLVDYVILIIISLIPFIWTRGNHIIFGHDAGTAISPSVHFLDRLFTWTERYGFGADQSFAIPGFFIHGMDFVFDLIHLPLWLNQSLSFVIFFFLMGYSMYYLASTLFKDKRYLPVFASVFYMVNHFTLQAWFIAERTKFTVYILFPFIIAFLYQIAHREKRPVKTGVISAILMTIFNGGGFIPLFGPIILCVPLFALFLIIQSHEKRRLSLDFLAYGLVTILVYLPLNLYWLLPYLSYAQASFATEVTKSGGIEGVLVWATEVSRNTSILNLFRLQGIQEWYANVYHTYAPYFLNNKLLIFVSFLLPVGALSSLVIARERDKKTVVNIALIGALSMMFMAGSHAPFGFIYVAMLRYVPGFIAFRTPFYKFAPGLWLAYALLIGYTIDYLITRYGHRYLKYIPVYKIVIALAIVGYSFPIVGIRFFTYFTDRSTRVTVPKYVNDYNAYANSNAFRYQRLLIFPPQSANTFAEQSEWGFWSIATINSLADKHSYVSFNLTNTTEENDMVLDLYQTAQRNDPSWIQKAKMLNIDGILLRKDMKPYEFAQNIISYKQFESLINKTPGIKNDKTFGKWSLYSFGEKTRPVTSLKGYYSINDYQKKDDPFPYDLPISVAKDSGFMRNPKSNIDSLKLADIIIPNCEHCSLIKEPIIEDTREISNLPGSPFYQFKLSGEASARKGVKNIKDLLHMQAATTTRRLFESGKLYELSASVDNKISLWNQYAAELELLSSYVKDYDKANPDGDEKNKTLMRIYDTLSMQYGELKDVLARVTSLDEGRAFNSTYSLIPSIMNYIDANSIHSTTPLQKKYLVQVTDPGTYDIYVKNNTLNVSDDAAETIRASVDNTQFASNILRKDSWTQLGTKTLNTGTIPAGITENRSYDILNRGNLSKVPNLKTNSDGSYTGTLSETHNCLELPLGKLDAERYQLRYKISTDSDPFLDQTFVNSEIKNLPHLPYLSKQFNVNGLSQNTVVELTTDTDHSTYVYEICNIYANNDISVHITDITLSKVSIPKLVFVKKNASYSEPKPFSMQVHKKDNTEYTVNASFEGPQLLQLNQRFDPRWTLTVGNQSLVPQATDTYANGWLMRNSQQGIMTIRFASQRSFNTGAVISALAAIGVVIFLFLWKR